MNIEIERKWLLSEKHLLKIFTSKAPHLSYQIFQGYFWADDLAHEFRIRLEKNNLTQEINAFLTIKEKTSNVIFKREELELSILLKDAFKLIKNDCERFIEKTKYLIKDKHIYEINYFSKEYIILEIEFQSEEEANNYIPNFEYDLEITKNKSFYNFNVASKLSIEEIEKKLEFFY